MEKHIDMEQWSMAEAVDGSGEVRLYRVINGIDAIYLSGSKPAPPYGLTITVHSLFTE
jgi:hypothetical protein